MPPYRPPPTHTQEQQHNNQRQRSNHPHLTGAVGWGYARRSLSRSGAIAALFVGAGSLACSLRCGAVLIAFFLSSSKLTQFKEELKEGLEENAKKGGQRDWKQARRWLSSTFCFRKLAMLPLCIYVMVWRS